jgi:G3E family GTPase
MESIALIINEFGEIGLDNLLVESSIENTLLLENGCICCSIRGDLVDTIGDLFAKARNGQIPDFSRILIETTGLANPAPIVNTIRNERVVADRCSLDSVVTVVDGVQGESQARSNPEAMIQIAQADVALVSKADLVNHQQADRIRRFVLDINPGVQIETMEHGRIAPEKLFGRGGAHSDRFLQLENSLTHSELDHGDHDHANHQRESSHGDISTWSFVNDGVIDENRLFNWLKMVYSLRASSMLRTKGLIRTIGRDGPLLVQAVGPIIDPVQELSDWPGGKPLTRLVFIVKYLSIEALRSSFERHVLST